MTEIFIAIGLSFLIGAALSALYFHLRASKVERKHARELLLRRNLLNAMSHQMREPLNELFPQVQLLSQLGVEHEEKRRKLSSGASKSVEAVSSVLERLADIIEALDGKRSKETTVFDVDALLGAAIEDCAVEGFDVELDRAGGGALLIGDANEIEKSIEAIVRHCIGVSADNKLKISRELGRRGKQDFLTVVFELNNLVFSNELQKCYFDFSYSEVNPHLKGRPNSLIGLFLAFETARRGGGELTVAQVDKARVQFRYTLSVGVKKLLEEVKTASAKQSAQEQSSPKIVLGDIKHVPDVRKLANSTKGLLTDRLVLIVDDVETNHLVLEEMLRMVGLTNVVHAERGMEAIDYCRQMNFDIVFMDIQMPDMDGLKATEHIRSLGGANKTLPIIAVTAASRIVTEELCLKSGMSGYLEKPLELDDIRALLRRVCKSAAA